jgi:hypothetical protein
VDSEEAAEDLLRECGPPPRALLHATSLTWWERHTDLMDGAIRNWYWQRLPAASQPNAPMIGRPHRRVRVVESAGDVADIIADLWDAPNEASRAERVWREWLACATIMILNEEQLAWPSYDETLAERLADGWQRHVLKFLDTHSTSHQVSHAAWVGAAHRALHETVGVAADPANVPSLGLVRRIEQQIEFLSDVSPLASRVRKRLARDTKGSRFNQAVRIGELVTSDISGMAWIGGPVPDANYLESVLAPTDGRASLRPSPKVDPSVLLVEKGQDPRLALCAVRVRNVRYSKDLHNWGLVQTLSELLDDWDSEPRPDTGWKDAPGVITHPAVLLEMLRTCPEEFTAAQLMNLQHHDIPAVAQAAALAILGKLSV